MSHRDLAILSLQKRVTELETVLRSLISCGSTSRTVQAMAMNALTAGSGDRWIEETSPTRDEERRT